MPGIEAGAATNRGAAFRPRSRGARRPRLALAAAAAASAFAASPARALDETKQLLDRAREGMTPTDRDRAVAREYLQEWVDTGPDDPALRRAFERIADGLPPAGGQLPALTRLHENYNGARAEAVARAEGRSDAWPGREPRGGSAAGWRPILRSYGKVAAAAGVVFALGLGSVLILRRRRTA